jgi:OmpR family response regulator RpaB
MYNEKILVVDCDVNIRKVLTIRLGFLGYKVFFASTSKETLSLLVKESPHLVLINIILSNLDGYGICCKIRDHSTIPIILLVGLEDVSSRIKGLELGADDYLVKPFSPIELEAKIRSLLRRSNPSLDNFLPLAKKNTAEIKIGLLVINLSTRQLFKNNTEIKLTNIEFTLLELLFEYAGKPLSRTIILNNVWGYTPQRNVDTRIVDVHISRLRGKLEDNTLTPDFILTARGIGYMFCEY